MMIPTNTPTISSISRPSASRLPASKGYRWLRYGISLTVTAVIALSYSLGWLPTKSVGDVCYAIIFSSFLINVRHQPPSNRYLWLTDDRHFILALINLAIVLLCFSIALTFLTEIPLVRIRELVESPATPWVWWSFLALVQLRQQLSSNL